VELATSGRQALERLTANTRFHVILCDVMMPDLAGKDLYEAVQQGGSGLEQRFVNFLAPPPWRSPSMRPPSSAWYATSC
jgi:CheY-like chemotaxis protein